MVVLFFKDTINYRDSYLNPRIVVLSDVTQPDTTHFFGACDPPDVSSLIREW